MPDPTYADVEDVELYLGNEINASSDPSTRQVQKLLVRAESYIEERTNTAFQATSTDLHYYDYPLGEYWWGTGVKVHLKHNHIQDPLDSTEGDTLEIWNGSSYDDFLSTMTEGRDEDYWLDYDSGTLYLRFPKWGWRKAYTAHKTKKDRIRVKYRYGKSSVPPDITEAAAKHTVAQLMLFEDYATNLGSGGAMSAMDSGAKRDEFLTDVERILRQHKRWEHR